MCPNEGAFLQLTIVNRPTHARNLLKVCLERSHAIKCNKIAYIFEQKRGFGRVQLIDW